MKKVKLNAAGSVYDAWLASACIPPDKLNYLTELFGGSEACFHAVRSGDERISQLIAPRFRTVLEENAKDETMAKLQMLMEKHSVGVLKISDQEYPEGLKLIDQPPVILFYQGNLQCLSKRMLSMVGSRAASYSGQKAARKLAADLSRRGVSIVSGLACGIDAASHTGCMEGGSPTIAVTASGPDIVYPSDHLKLKDDILQKNGLILTEYAPGEKPAGWHFPFRNRIIAGLGRALILVEAKIRSGSMTSVRHALDQGKEVFVYPGDPESAYFEGNHQLLREGGVYFTCAEDILDDLDWLDNQSTVRQNSDCSDEEKAANPEQAAVLGALTPGKLSFEQLVEKTHLDPPALMGTLTVLQICGKIEALPGKMYQIKQ